MGRLTGDRPKCLIELAGAALIEHQIATLRAAGIEEIVVVAGYRADALDIPGVTKFQNPRWNETNMVETLFCAEPTFGDDVVVSYADIVYEPKVLDALLASPHPISVVVDRGWRAYWELRFDAPLSDAESLRLAADETIAEIGNRPSSLDEIEAQYIGLMRFRGPGIDALRRTREAFGAPRRPWMDERPIDNAYMTDFLMEMILRGDAVHAVPIDGGWLEIDTEHDYAVAKTMVADGTIGRLSGSPARARSTSENAGAAAGRPSAR